MSFSKYTGIGGAGGITVYPNAAAFPASATDGEQAVAADTNTIYIYDSSIPGWVPVATPPVGVFISDLTGDVTATGPGSAAATVDFVGGETAADVATSVQDTQAATDLSTPSTLVKRDAGGETSLDGLNLDGSTSGAINIKAADTTTNYTVKMPAAQGGATTYLENDGSGNLSWGTITIPPSANQTLSNLTSPTAINQNLNLGSNAISQTNYIISPQLYDAGTFAGAIALNWANGPAQKLVINAAGPLAITLSNPVTGGTYLLRLEQGATPGTVTWPGSVNWGTVGAPVLSNATGEVDIVSLFYDGTTYWASAQIQDALPAANYSLTNLSFFGLNEQVLALGSTGPYWATEGVKTGYPTNSVIVGKLKPAGFTSQQSIILGTGTTGDVSTGVDSILIGYNAAPALATGTGSIAIGSTSVIGAAISNGIALGTSANCSGATSMAIGASAATGTGADNTVIGNGAGRSASSGVSNTIIGRAAGDALTTGANNVYIGHNAAGASTTGATSVVIGELALSTATGATRSVVVGYLASQSTTSMDLSIVLGRTAAQGATTVNSSTVIGSSTVASGSVTSCVIIGHEAAQNPGTTTGLVCIGRESARGATTPTDGTFVGYFSGNRSQGQNTFVGAYAGRNVTGASAITNTAVGYQAMNGQTIAPYCTSTNTVSVGHNSGLALTTGSNNTLIGAVAGTALTTGSLNTLIGNTAGDAITTGSNNTIIGDIAGTTTLADTVIVAAGTAERFRVDSNGNMGLGTTAPNVRLDVQNTTAATNTVTNILRLDSQSSGTPAAGIGSGIEMAAETAAGNTEVGVVLEAITNDVTAASEGFDFVVKTMTAGVAATEKLKVGSNGSTTVANGDLILNTAGNGINIKEGTNARLGITGAFPGTNPNTVTVSTTEVTANSRIFLTAQSNPGGHQPDFWISTVTANTSFVITSHDNNFTGTVAWIIFEPA